LKIRFTPAARRQFLSAIAYIRRDKAGAALEFRQKAERILRRLESFPDSGRKIPEFPELPHRELIVRPYRFFYRQVDELIWIVAVWHGAQLPAEPPGQASEQVVAPDSALHADDE
jgi:plasmid stabilization system protein ParE